MDLNDYFKIEIDEGDGWDEWLDYSFDFEHCKSMIRDVKEDEKEDGKPEAKFRILRVLETLVWEG